MFYLCAINNISSGNCSGDCKFCTQSAFNKAAIEKYRFKDIKNIIEEAKLAYKNKAVGYCLVTSGEALNDKTLEFVAKTAKELKKTIPSLSLIGCNGLASKEQLNELKKAGIDSYNHNLETSKEYYPKICTTHKWTDRLQTAIDVKSVGLNLCSGGIFGMSESSSDILSLIDTLAELNPMSVPINFFIPNKALSIKQTISTKSRALEIISLIKVKLPNSMLMVAGGREHIFGNDIKSMYDHGISSMIIGDYLTTKGEQSSKDLANLKRLKIKLATNC